MGVLASTDVLAAKPVKVKSKQRPIAYSHYKKANLRSVYKKGFSRSKRRFQISSRSSSSSCLSWNANKINDKADKFKVHIRKYSRQYRVNRNLVKAVITAESCFRTKALSSAGAQGLM